MFRFRPIPVESGFANASGMKQCLLRKGRASLDGQVYLVTFTTVFRAPLFADPETARVACTALTDMRLWRHAALLAWVLMPDHWHGLIQLDNEALSRTVQRLKCNTARRVNLVAARCGAVWAPAFHDHALRSEEDLLHVARYIVLNPVRAGLVRRVGDYPYWDAIWI